MRKILSKEPKIRRYFYILLGIVITIIVLISGIIYVILDKAYKNNIYIVTTAVGQLVEKNPNEEKLITESVIESINKGEEDNQKAFQKGNEVLKQYGYDERLKFYNDSRNMSLIRDIFRGGIIFGVLVLLGAICLYLNALKDFIKRIKGISSTLDLLIEKKYLQDEFKESEGEFGIVDHKIRTLSNVMKSSSQKFNLEKDNLKSFIADIAHQIKTPVTSIKIINSILLEQEVEDIKKDFLISCDQEISRLQWMVDSLIKISNIEVGAFQLNMKKQDMKTTLTMALNSVYGKALDKRIDIEVEAIESYKVNHDMRWTKEALTNILENSIKYTTEGGGIKISLIKNTMGCELVIKDTGIGIEKENINKIFKRFYRENSKEILEQSGSGLGLYITRKVLEAQSASITVDSEKNKGSIFTIYFFT